MRIAFFVNDVATEIDEYTTTRLAGPRPRAGTRSGTSASETSSSGKATGSSWPGRMPQSSTRTTRSKASWSASRSATPNGSSWTTSMPCSCETNRSTICRSGHGPVRLGVVFGQMLKARGVTVVNDPMSLLRATSKLYLEEFPEKIRPRSLVTRDPEAIERFVGKVGHSVVKPLYGAKGRNVFMIEDEGETNLAQMTEAVLQDGYAIVQEFVDGGEDGDARIFLLEGQILQRDGKLAAFRRVPTGNDPRANISTGGRSVPLEIGDEQRGIIEAMSEKLVADGMYFVGIDVIGDKVVEINAESPGGMQSVERLYEIDVCPTVIEALERRTASKS